MWRPAVEVTDVPATTVAALVRDALAAGRVVTWRARGNSMRPAIRDGEAVRLVAPAHLGRGDVAMAALPDGRLVLHRVVACDGDVVALRGDALRQPDPLVRIGDVVAVADPAPAFRPGAVLLRWLPSRRPLLRLVPPRGPVMP